MGIGALAIPGVGPLVAAGPVVAALAGAGASPEVSAAVIAENEHARLAGLRTALALLAVVGLIALFFTRRIPLRQPGDVAAATAGGDGP